MSRHLCSKSLGRDFVGLMALFVLGCFPATQTSAPTPDAPLSSHPNGGGDEETVRAVSQVKTQRDSSESPAKNSVPDPLDSLNPPLGQTGIAFIQSQATGREIQVKVEIASNDADRAKGLMYRRHLDEDGGMFFAFPREEALHFWMENTLIELDMIFIRADGTVLGVVENAEPLTRISRFVPGLSQFVLEVNGGFCASNHIQKGDRVRIEGMFQVQ